MDSKISHDLACEMAARNGRDAFNPDVQRSSKDQTYDQALRLEQIDSEKDILNDTFGIDPNPIRGHEITSTTLSRSPAGIANAMPSEFRALHIENIVRIVCARRFWNARSHIQGELAQLLLSALRQCIRGERRFMMGERGYDKEAPMDLITEPEITFHSTEEQHVPSVVRHWFLRPGTTLDVRCGSTYGRPEASPALISYPDNLRTQHLVYTVRPIPYLRCHILVFAINPSQPLVTLVAKRMRYAP